MKEDWHQVGVMVRIELDTMHHRVASFCYDASGTDYSRRLVTESVDMMRHEWPVASASSTDV